jgi:hypothetical protein
VQRKAHIVACRLGEIVIILAQAVVLPSGQLIVGYVNPAVAPWWNGDN